MYGWTPDYLLDGLTFKQVMMYYRRGIEFEVTKSKIMVSTMNGGTSNNETETETTAPAKSKDPTPDRAAFHARYGNKIKRG